MYAIFCGDEREIIDNYCFRYPLGKLKLPYFTEWVVTNLGTDLAKKVESIPPPPLESYPPPNVGQDFINELKTNNISLSLDGDDRLFRSHGHTLHDIYNIRTGNFPRIPDVVAWPESHDDVVRLVELAKKHNVAIIPFGGGTSVSGALSCPENEKRTIMSLDTSQMVH